MLFQTTRRHFQSTFLIGMLATFVYGCTNVKIKSDSTRELTGLFGNDREKFMVALKRIEVDKTTLAGLKEMGIDIFAKNVKRYGGYDAATHLADGNSSVTIQLDPGKFSEDIVKYRNLMLVRIPYKDITTRSKRIYFSNNFKEVKGYDTVFSIVLDKGVVVYAPPPDDHTVDTLHKSHAFGRGFIELFGEVASPVGGISRAIP